MVVTLFSRPNGSCKQLRQRVVPGDQWAERAIARADGGQPPGLDMEPLAPQPRGTCDHHAPYPIRSAIRVNDMMVRVLCENGGDVNIKLGQFDARPLRGEAVRARDRPLALESEMCERLLAKQGS